MLNYVGRFLDFLDERAVFRRTAFVVVLYGTIKITYWAMGCWDSWLASGKSGVEAAAMVAAITGPFTALQGWVIKIYTDYRGRRDHA